MIKQYILTGVLAFLLVGCGQENRGWRGVDWWTPHGEVVSKISDAEFTWRKVDSVPSPWIDAIEDVGQRMLAQYEHHKKHPQIEDRTLPPMRVKGILREGACIYSVDLYFNPDGELKSVTETSSLLCSDAAKDELNQRFGAPTFSESIPVYECRTPWEIIETMAWTKENTRVLYERKCRVNQFTVEYYPMQKQEKTNP